MNQQRYVAFIDILGFKNIINQFKNPEDLGRELLFNFNASLHAALNNSSITIDLTKGILPKVENSEISFCQFSDSIILYSKDDNVKNLEEFIRVLNMFLASSILRGFPLRGALVKGDIFANPPIIVGKGLVNAATNEAKQAWSGLIVDSSCFDVNDGDELLKRMLLEKMLVNTKVPIKTGKKQEGSCLDQIVYQDQTVINWPQFMGLYISSGIKLNTLFEKFSGKPYGNALIKIEHTIEFFKENIGSRKLPPFTYTAEIVDTFSLLNTKEKINCEFYNDGENSR
ncbi:hypothetical protein B4102_3551 [Heyndrickxia sporothermodurans]|uniref:Guanylate cyclase domain-containing protein n=1 Tax=Heyndrickxia sporothermodurans TaxID=46224 RepID=A0A150KM36_9BACI|nr:hypothetical protein [Heyndrickxia sporothermodurans]KYC96145.1 hypothetical protein B4102_3551 [Heyndrickxia sporothermodurans]